MEWAITAVTKGTTWHPSLVFRAHFWILMAAISSTARHPPAVVIRSISCIFCACVDIKRACEPVLKCLLTSILQTLCIYSRRSAPIHCFWFLRTWLQTFGNVLILESGQWTQLGAFHTLHPQLQSIPERLDWFGIWGAWRAAPSLRLFILPYL